MEMGRLHALLGIVALLASSPLVAQNAPAPDDAGAVTQPATAESPLLDPEVPPTLVRTASSPDDRVTIPISIDGKGPWPFVIDTGAQRTVISRDLAERLQLQPRKNVTILSMTGRAEVGTVDVPRLGFGGGTLDIEEAPVLEGQHLGAPGLLGLDSLHAKRVLLDFRGNRMHISNSRSNRTDSSDPDTIIVEARRRKGQLILLNSDVNGMRVDIILDTGANFCVGNMALMTKLIRKKKAPELLQASLISVTGGSLTGQVAKIKSVRMGRVTLRDVPVLFAEATPFAELGLGKRPALLLGMNALRLFDRVAIDFGRGKVDFLLPDMGALEKARFAAR